VIAPGGCCALATLLGSSLPLLWHSCAYLRCCVMQSCLVDTATCFSSLRMFCLLLLGLCIKCFFAVSTMMGRVCSRRHVIHQQQALLSLLPSPAILMHYHALLPPQHSLATAVTGVWVALALLPAAIKCCSGNHPPYHDHPTTALHAASSTVSCHHLAHTILCNKPFNPACCCGQ
jgi:hypothetical protein